MINKFLIVSKGGNFNDLRNKINNNFTKWWDLTGDSNIDIYIVGSDKYSTVTEVRNKLKGFSCSGVMIIKIYTGGDHYTVGEYSTEKNNNWIDSYDTDDANELISSLCASIVRDSGIVHK